MNLSVRDLQDLLQGNPDLGIVDDGVRFLEKSNNRIIERKIERMSEHDLQRYIIDECDRRAITRPAYGLIFAVPNGQYRQGQRMEPGLRPGIPDLFLPIARDHGAYYHGLFIELKVGKNSCSNDQEEWIERLEGQGYCCRVVWDSVERVMAVLEWYLEGK